MKAYLFLFLFAFSGCATTPLNKSKSPSPAIPKALSNQSIIRDPSKSLPKMPSVSYHYPGLTDKDVRKSLGIAIHNWHRALFPDTHYVRIKYDSFTSFNSWFREATLQLWHKKLGDGYDCDNYAFLYKSLLGVSSYKNNNIREVLIGIIYVKQENDFGGIKAGQFNHAVNIVGTENGWMVFEPQTGKFDKLENYPNKILWYIF